MIRLWTASHMRMSYEGFVVGAGQSEKRETLTRADDQNVNRLRRDVQN